MFRLFVVLAAVQLTALESLGQPVNEALVSSVDNVRSYGAKGDGKALDSPAINQAIKTAAAKGGGTVYFPAGTYRSFSIRLASNINLHFAPGSVLLAASPNDGDGKYDPPEPNEWDKYQDFGHSHWHNSLIWGENLENVSITGSGLIWGKGLVRSGFQSRSKERNDILKNFKAVRPEAPFGFPNPRDTVESGWGNKAIALKLVRNVTIRDISILEGGHFAILATGVDNLTVDNVKIDTNRDGFNIDACRNVRISNMSVNSPVDDGIVLKSSYALGFARPTENVTITNSLITGYAIGTMLDGTFQRELKNDKREFRSETGPYNPTGRIKFGTESNSGFRNITISNVVFDYSSGLALESVDGGVLEDVTIDNVLMRDIADAPFFLRLGFRARGPKETTNPGAMRRISISNVTVYNADSRYASIISGIPGSLIEDVRLNNIRIYYRGGGTIEEATAEPPENIAGYPEPEMFGKIPASGFYIRHVKNIEMNDIEISFLKDDARPPFVLNDVQAADFHRVKARHLPSVKTFRLRNILDFKTSQVESVPDLRIEHATFKEL